MSIKCSKCNQLNKIRSGASTYYKCDWLDEFVDSPEDCLKNCPRKQNVQHNKN